MHGSTYRVECPSCGEEGAVEVRYSRDYQGSGPWGGTVEAADEVVPFCRCKLTHEQEQAAIAAAENGEGAEVTE